MRLGGGIEAVTTASIFRRLFRSPNATPRGFAALEGRPRVPAYVREMAVAKIAQNEFGSSFEGRWSVSSELSRIAAQAANRSLKPSLSKSAMPAPTLSGRQWRGRPRRCW